MTRKAATRTGESRRGVDRVYAELDPEGDVMGIPAEREGGSEREQGKGAGKGGERKGGR